MKNTSFIELYTIIKLYTIKLYTIKLYTIYTKVHFIEKYYKNIDYYRYHLICVDMFELAILKLITILVQLLPSIKI